MEKQVTAVGYVRVSTEEQAKEGYSLPAQEKAIASYCAAVGWDLTTIYRDEGVSGKSRKGREGLASLLSHPVDRVVVWRLDRLTRSLADLLAICGELELTGAGLVSVTESIDTATPSGRMLRNMLGTIGEFERESIAERVRLGIFEKVSNGRHVGNIAFGYQRVEGVNHPVPDPETAPLVQEMFTRYAAGSSSVRDLSLWLRSLGYYCTPASIHRRLKAEFYRGNVVLGSSVFPGNHEALVSNELWEAVQARLMARRLGMGGGMKPWGKRPYVLTGILFCSRCGGRMFGCVMGKKAKRYYRCPGQRDHGDCEQGGVMTQVFEDQVAAYLANIAITPGDVAAVLAEVTREANPQLRRADVVRNKLSRLRTLYVEGDLTKEEYEAKKGPLVDSLAKLDKPRITTEAAAGFLSSFSRVWEAGADQPEIQRRLALEVLARVEVKDKEVVAIEPKPAYAPFFVQDRDVRHGGVYEYIKSGVGGRYCTPALLVA